MADPSSLGASTPEQEKMCEIRDEILARAKDFAAAEVWACQSDAKWHADEFNDWADRLTDILAASPSPPVTQEPFRELVREASEIMQITYAGNFPAGIESFLVRAHAAMASLVTCEWREDDEGALTAGCNTSRTPVRFSWAVAKGFAACPYCKSPLSLSSGGTPKGESK